MKPNDFHDLIRRRVEHLRPKLLDLGRRNPLISTKLAPRSGSHIRIIDEVFGHIFSKLCNGGELQIIPLPELDEDPRDESSKRFTDALANAQLTDDEYLEALKSLDENAEDFADRARVIERQLRDRLRAALHMPERPQKSDTNLSQHARNNGIHPSYDLLTDSEDERHADDKIQTLLLPKDLERKLNGISSKCKTWLQETGINVLHIAYGFIEWSEPNQTETSVAPLVLASIAIEKRRTMHGPEYWISGTGEDAELNAVFAEKLKEYTIELPPYDGGELEPYLASVEALQPKSLTWKLRRQVAIGVFPSARMAMYHDLDPTHPLLGQSEIVGKILGGSSDRVASPFADDYHVDQPEIERLVPFLVLDADSSQHSALADIASNKNLAIEGPPGTGKSQTIVNAIAAAMASGKKVLFVAEKLAALNVVKARLEAIGLGEFLLPLQAERSTREQVIASLRDRVEMSRPGTPRDYDGHVAQFRRLRDELAEYIGILTTRFETTGLTVHDILSKSIAISDRLKDIPLDVLSLCSIETAALTKGGLQDLRDSALRVERTYDHAVVAGDSWRATQLTTIDRFSVEELCDGAACASQAYRQLARLRTLLSAFGLDADTPRDCLTTVADNIKALAGFSDREQTVAAQLLPAEALALCSTFAGDVEAGQRDVADLQPRFTAPADDTLVTDLARMSDLCQAHGFYSLDTDALERTAREQRDRLKMAAALHETIKPLLAQRPDAVTWNFSDILQARECLTAAGRPALSLRSDMLANPAARGILARLVQDCKTLQATRAELARHANLDVEVPPEELREIAATLAASHFLSFLIGSHRKAVRSARLLVVSPNFNRALAVTLVKEVATFRARERDFLRDPQATAVFGFHFRGIDTDLAPFERILEFYDAVDQGFSASERRTLGQFLRTAPLDDLDLLPPVPADIDMGNSESLQRDLIERAAEFSAAEQAIEAIKPLVSRLSAPASVGPADLQGLSQRTATMLRRRAALDGADAVARLITPLFAGSATDAGLLRRLCEWSARAQPQAAAVAAVIASQRGAEAILHLNEIVKVETDAESATERIHEVARLPARHFQASRGLTDIADVLARASKDSDGLFAHTAFAGACEALGRSGVQPLIRYRLHADLGLAGINQQVEALAARTLARRVYRIHGDALNGFPGIRLDELRAALAKKDREIIKLSRLKLQRKIYDDANPPPGIGVGRRSTWTDMALIENEIAKQRRFISVRDLTERAGKALMELKPCWMMSPLAVAQYVRKGDLNFDLCIIDEASQMPPEAAIGALLRCSQTVVVGDTNQLPPSSFFRKMIDDDDADEDDAVLNESILEMANATFRPARRLRWHYRSRHSGLIQFSNRMIYESGLVVFPSATESMAQMGVVLKSVDGLYKAGTNPIEARAVVDAVVDFMRNDPDRSLGVVTLNQKQRELIFEEFEHVLAHDAAVQTYVDRWRNESDGLEEFFIKNLENVQGDERDVIFIGTVYGPESAGARVAQRFGPINGVAGKRRLNVLFSRAKQKIVTFSSMSPADILAEEEGNAGVYMLKRWLEYSATGRLESGERTSREPDSEFEVFVIEQIKSMGLIPVPQVGVAGYFIDIGIRHPDWPHGYILGVECDGASYHSAKSARDRDRLRQQILENLGWQLHRIWSTDWFNNPSREAERLRVVVENRMKELRMVAAEWKLPETVSSETVPAERPANTPLAAAPPLPGLLVDPASSIQIGDTVRVRFLTDDRKTLQIKISRDRNETASGIIHHEMPMAQALLGAAEGDEIEIQVGSYIRSALIESVLKAKAEQTGDFA